MSSAVNALDFWTYASKILAIYSTYAAVMLIWPKMVFNRFLKGKKIWYQIFFCTTVMICILTLFFDVLGALGFLNALIVRIFFYGGFAVALCLWIFRYIDSYRALKEGEVLEIPFVSYIMDKFSSFTEKFKNYEGGKLSENPWLNLILDIVLVTVIACFMIALGAQLAGDWYYNFSDISRHEGFIRELFNEQFYPNGIYPYGMHYVIYTMVDIIWGSVSACNPQTGITSTLYDFNLGSTKVTMLLFFIALYYWAKSVLKSKGTIVLFFALFLLLATTILYLDQDALRSGDNIRMVHDGIFRMSRSLPEEFCMYAVFIAPVCLTKIFKSAEKTFSPENRKYLFLLATSIGTTICTHYYTLIFQFIMCAATALCFIPKYTVDKIKWIAASVLGGTLLGFIPLGIAYLKVPQWSVAVNWATGVTNNTSRVAEKLASVVPTAKPNSLWDDCIDPLFKNQTTSYTGFAVVLFVFAIIALIFCAVKRRKDFPQYLIPLVAFIGFFLIYAAPSLHIQRIMESYRAIICLFSCLLVFFCVPFDMLLTIPEKSIKSIKKTIEAQKKNK